ncbi:hypothetical protein RDI58_010607 [Solanum bulbocastanum]|uniref:Uncharacterized protein n=1 Tax=Solanum bulbocastanum TaxID=147425 RepID=A0AAN8TWN7_SOLBU
MTCIELSIRVVEILEPIKPPPITTTFSIFNGAQDLTTPTSETKKKDHPIPTGENSQQNGKDNDQTPSNNKSKCKPSKQKNEAIKRTQQKEAEIQGTKVQERQIARNMNRQQKDDNSNHIRIEFN